MGFVFHLATQTFALYEKKRVQFFPIGCNRTQRNTKVQNENWGWWSTLAPRGFPSPDVGRIVWQMMEREKVVPDYRLANAMLRLCVYAQRDDWALEVCQPPRMKTYVSWDAFRCNMVTFGYVHHSTRAPASMASATACMVQTDPPPQIYIHSQMCAALASAETKGSLK